jgi:beta-galactosidase
MTAMTGNVLRAWGEAQWLTLRLLRTIGIVLLCFAAIFGSPGRAERIELNDAWVFSLGDQPGAERTGFDDRDWRRIAVPHDWSIEDRPGQSHPFDPKAPGGAGEAFTIGGVGWYRRVIDLPADIKSRSVLLRFEGVYMDARIFVNGRELATHHNGYTAFTLDIGSSVRPGANIVAVRVNHQQPSSRWYSGSGILRPVYLDILDKVHIAPNGTAIATPIASSGQSTVEISTELTNDNSGKPVNATLLSRVLDSAGKEVARAETGMNIRGRSTAPVKQNLTLTGTALWSPDSPNLYTLDQQVRLAGRTVDRRRTRFGVRTIAFDAKQGLLINGKRTLLRGGAIHSDNYMLGGVALARAEERRLEIMKQAGYNAVRSAHNPASQGLLNAADRLGMLVIDEAFDVWTKSKREFDYSRFFQSNWQADVRAQVESSRNHPSLIMWSTGNEIPELPEPVGAEYSKAIADLFRRLDPTRPVTAAVHIIAPGTEAYVKPLDIVGYNYLPEHYAPVHAVAPEQVMYASESFPNQAYDSWTPTETMPWVIGDFVWTGWDYLGEAGIGWTGFDEKFGIGPYPWQLSMSGEIDATGRLRPAAYYRQIVWKSGINPTVAFVEWNGAEGSMPDKLAGGPRALRNWVHDDLIPAWQPFGFPADYLSRKVVVYSENEEVELFVNGRSYGRKPVGKAGEYKATYFVRFEPGELKAVGYVNGTPASQWTLQTAGKPAAVRLSVDRASITGDGNDLAYITATLVDDKGRSIYDHGEDIPLRFTVSGAGELAGVGNGDPTALESFRNGVRSTWHGRAVAAVRAGKEPGRIQVQVDSEALPSAAVDVDVVPPVGEAE